MAHRARKRPTCWPIWRRRREPLAHRRVAAATPILARSSPTLLLEQTDLRRERSREVRPRRTGCSSRPWLEQATDEWIAGYKAPRFAGRGPIADLCCGIGGDLLALAGQGPRSASTAIRSPPVWPRQTPRRCSRPRLPHDTIASDLRRRANSIFPILPPGISIPTVAQSATALRPSNGAAPIRPSSSDFSPPFPTRPSSSPQPPTCPSIGPIAASSNGSAATANAVNSSPGTATSHDRPESAGPRFLDNDGKPRRTVVGQPNIGVPIAERLGRFVYEPDSAVLAAHLTGVLAADHGLDRVSTGIAYLTGDTAADDPALSCFEVDDVLPFETSPPCRLPARARHRHARNQKTRRRSRSGPIAATAQTPRRPLRHIDPHTPQRQTNRHPLRIASPRRLRLHQIAFPCPPHPES